MESRLVQSTARAMGDISLQAAIDLVPFNSLSVSARSLVTIVYLALSVHGWWKERDKSKVLRATIESYDGNKLLSAVSFEARSFERIERRYPFRGITINQDEHSPLSAQGGTVHELPLIPDSIDEPELCLRALASALLCLFDEEETFSIIFKIAQDCLIHFGKDNPRFPFHGPFAGALKNWLVAQRTRELFRRKCEDLMRELDLAREEVSNVTVQELRDCQIFEEMLVTSFLRWALTQADEPNPQAIADYPTRSFRVWSLAFLLGGLGFDIETSRHPVRDKEVWQVTVDRRHEADALRKVHLITTNSVIADPGCNLGDSRRSVTRERRLIPIGAIPTMAFEHFRAYAPEGIDTDVLSEIFTDSFNEVTQELPSYACFRGLADLQDKDRNSGPAQAGTTFVAPTLSAYQREKIEDWVPHPEMLKLIGRSVSKHIPTDCPDRCGRTCTNKCNYTAPFLNSRGMNSEASYWMKDLRAAHNDMTPWIKMHMIMLAFAFATACQFILTDDGNRANLDTEVSWLPIKLFESESWDEVRIVVPDGDLRTWVRTTADTLRISLEPFEVVEVEKWPQHRRLKSCLCHMVCGYRTAGGM